MAKKKHRGVQISLVDRKTGAAIRLIMSCDNAADIRRLFRIAEKNQKRLIEGFKECEEWYNEHESTLNGKSAALDDVPEGHRTFIEYEVFEVKPDLLVEAGS